MKFRTENLNFHHVLKTAIKCITPLKPIAAENKTSILYAELSLLCNNKLQVDHEIQCGEDYRLNDPDISERCRGCHSDTVLSADAMARVLLLKSTWTGEQQHNLAWCRESRTIQKKRKPSKWKTIVTKEVKGEREKRSFHVRRWHPQNVWKWWAICDRRPWRRSWQCRPENQSLTCQGCDKLWSAFVRGRDGIST